MTAPKKPVARKPMSPPLRKVPGPINQSSAAGQPAPASAAATAPFVPPSSPPPTQTSPLDTQTRPLDAANRLPPSSETMFENDGKRAGFKMEYVETVRSGSAPIEQGGSVDREVAEHMAAEAINDPDDLEAEIARIRAKRLPIGAYSQKLALPKRNGYHRHWFNDTAGRIEEAENNGWTFVRGIDGKPISRCVGSGRDKGALYAFAMEIPEVFWLEDMARNNQIASDKIDALKASPFQSKPGQAQASDKGKFYDPNDGDEGPLQVIKG